uniref:Putative tnf receptor-associated factor 6 n=1 Tax=Anopheles braziliensis TaxID=58242 RepID=A0A2M3Z6H8_9DIPT
MSRSVKREVSAEENCLQNASKTDDGQLEARYECPICYCWLNEPILTKCGHRFCRKCITDWLNEKNSNCPLDNEPLDIKCDIFPDNCTRREISQIKKPCPNWMRGCADQLSPTEIDSHQLQCPFGMSSQSQPCPFARVKCKFVGRDEATLNEHIATDYQKHLQLLLDSYTGSGERYRFWDPPEKNSAPEMSTNELVRSMYERIVILEQELHILSIKLSKQDTQLAKVHHEVDPRYSAGVLLWKLDDFSSKVDTMQANSNCMFYSGEAYTSPHGYKFCARINVPSRTKEFIGLHVHLMQSENDYHLEWPFKGRIKITLLNVRNPERSQHDTIMSKPEILAFHRPNQEISPRGFGFLEFAKIKEVLAKFMDNNMVVIKIEMNIV